MRRSHPASPVVADNGSRRVEGLTFSAPSIVLTIPAGQTTTVRIVGTASSPGNLVVRGCRVRLTHCRRRDFLIPVPAADRAKARLLRNLHTRYDRPKSEHGGLHRPLEDDGRADERPERYLNCKVVAPTPLLRIVSTSLLQGGLMLYEGERYCSVTVQTCISLRRATGASSRFPSRTCRRCRSNGSSSTLPTL